MNKSSNEDLEVYIECRQRELEKILRNPPRIAGDVETIIRRGRFREEYDLLFMKSGRRVFAVKIFCGRDGFRAWAEIYGVDPGIFLEIEDSIYEILSNALGPGEDLYVEYIWDEESMRLIDLGAPPQVTRIGFNLLKRGFTWFKTWYYPEGFMEGSIKIQAEKPISEVRRLEHVREICREVREFTSLWSFSRDPLILRALDRARVIDEILRCSSP
ncbi:MAG: DUF1122 family protein, partial [Sulfolobales archaeon]